MISIHMHDCIHNYRTKVLHAHADILHFILEKTVECIDLTIIIYRFGFWQFNHKGLDNTADTQIDELTFSCTI